MEQVKIGIGWRQELALTIERGLADGLDFIEVVAESISPREIPRPLKELRARGATIIPHGVGLSLGSVEPPAPGHLDHLARLAEHFQSPLVSEHIAFVRAGGYETGHLLPLPFTHSSLEVLVENIRLAQKSLPVPLALENIANVFQWPGAEMSEAQFIRAAIESTGALLLLDVANLYANRSNYRGLQPDGAVASGEGALDETDTPAEIPRHPDLPGSCPGDGTDPFAGLPLNRLAYVHVAGGYQRNGFYHDTHAHSIPIDVLRLLEELCSRRAPIGVVLERDDRFPSPPELETELAAIRSAVLSGSSRLPRHLAARGLSVRVMEGVHV